LSKLSFDGRPYRTGYIGTLSVCGTPGCLLNRNDNKLQVEDYLTDFNGESKSPMNLAMFLYAVEHISRICRVLIQPGSHMLLVGVGGSGRQSLSRLAAYMCQMTTFQIAISKSYTSVEWRDDLKSYMRKSGAEDKNCVFVFSDTQIKLESFVEDINNLLNSGEVPNMLYVDNLHWIFGCFRL
jgi:dynein heavy chain